MKTRNHLTAKAGGTAEALPAGATGDADASQDEGQVAARKADRYLWIGLAFVGTWMFGLVGLPFLVVSFIWMKKARDAGVVTRPWAVTIVGGLTLVDSMINSLGWGTDLLWSHDTNLIRTLWSGYGKLVDSAYYVDYNSTALGGTAMASEKAIQIGSVLVMWPMRFAAAYGFLKMKRWGLQAMIITSWMYVFWWTIYVPNLYIWFNARNATDYGQTLLWFILTPYWVPFLMIPYLYSCNREQFD